MSNIVTHEDNTLVYRPGECVNCGMCIEVCPHAVFAPGKKAISVVSHSSCMECGACVMNCPTTALAVEAGVGCAEALIWQAIKGGDAPACCGPSVKNDTCC